MDTTSAHVWQFLKWVKWSATGHQIPISGNLLARTKKNKNNYAAFICLKLFTGCGQIA